MTITNREVTAFRQQLSAHYERYGRHELPWRQTDDAYCILVSELMLQQTQVSRVIPKYAVFVAKFPTVAALAEAQLGDVLQLWQGLGYNRRAKYLWQAARQIVQQYDARIPNEVRQLVKLPGIGANTAGAILAYAFNQPVIFIETNVRTVYFHHFFSDRTDIADRELLPLIEATLDKTHPREFYWALMDYGSWLKHQGHGAISRSRHYSRQTSFAGSRRQLRGLLLRSLSQRPYTQQELLDLAEDDRSLSVLDDLIREEMVVRERDSLRLA